MDHKKTSIIMPMHNQLGYSILAVDSLYRNTNREEFELICIDDASTDGTSDYLDGLEGVQVIHFKENVGFDRAVNAGIKVAKGEYTAVLNNDLILTPYWLPQLISILESDPHIGIVVPACNSSSNFQVITAPYNGIVELDEFAKKYNHSDDMRWQERIRLIFYAALFRTRELKAFGGMDEQFSPGGFEDDDLSLRYRRAGYRLIFTTDTYVHHFGSVSMSKTGAELLAQNRARFWEKHHIDSWEMAVINIPLVNAYDFPRRKSLRLLGIGSGAGSTLSYMKSMYMERCRLVPIIDYLCKRELYLQDAATMCDRAIKYEERAAFLEEEMPSYDLILFEEVLKEEEVPGILEEYKKWIKIDGDVVLLLPKTAALAEEFEGYRMREKKELSDSDLYIFSRSE